MKYEFLTSETGPKMRTGEFYAAMQGPGDLYPTPLEYLGEEWHYALDAFATRFFEYAADNLRFEDGAWRDLDGNVCPELEGIPEFEDQFVNDNICSFTYEGKIYGIIFKTVNDDTI